MLKDLEVSVAEIDAGRFVLRPLRKSDEGPIGFHAGDERVARMTSAIPHPYPPGAAEAYVARAMKARSDGDEVVWAMDNTANGGSELMGVISLKTMDRNQAEVGYWVAPSHWNTGVASAAVKALVKANPLKNETYFARVFQENAASARVLTNCGFAYLGDAETFCVARNARVPIWTYSRRLD